MRRSPHGLARSVTSPLPLSCSLLMGKETKACSNSFPHLKHHPIFNKLWKGILGNFSYLWVEASFEIIQDAQMFKQWRVLICCLVFYICCQFLLETFDPVNWLVYWLLDPPDVTLLQFSREPCNCGTREDSTLFLSQYSLLQVTLKSPAVICWHCKVLCQAID